MKFHELLECYNVVQEDQDKEDPRNIEIPEIEGKCIVKGPELEFVAYAKPLRMHKVNIGKKENTKFAQIGDY
jgi:hypothetical protein